VVRHSTYVSSSSNDLSVFNLKNKMSSGNTNNKFRYYLLEKKYGSYGLKDLWRITKRLFIYAMYIYIPASMIATISNNFVVKDDRYAAILLSGYAFSDYDYWAAPFAFSVVILPGRFTLIVRDYEQIIFLMLQKKILKMFYWMKNIKVLS